jgi:hypothetical protein
MNRTEQNPLLAYLVVVIGSIVLLKWLFRRIIVPGLYPLLKKLFRKIILANRRYILPTVNFDDNYRHSK